MTVSVVVPAYQAAAFIGRTLASVAAQTRPPDEVVVVDDGSPDDTAAAARAAAGGPCPVRVIRLPANSGGPAGPLNVGIEAARGDWIATLDHDDAFPPAKLAALVPLLAAHPGLGLVFGDLVLDGPDPDLNRRAAGWLGAGIAALPKRPLAGGGYRVGAAAATAGVVRSKSFVGTCSNMVFPKAAWRAVGGFDEGTTVSCDLAFLAAVAGRFDLGYVPAPSAVWTLHPNSFYRTASAAARIRDQLRVFGRVARGPLPAGVRAELRAVVRELAFDGAFGLRQAGDYRAAAACLWGAIRITGPWPAGVAGLAKLVPHRATRRGPR